MLRFSLLLCAVLIVSASPARSWGPDGHRLVCTVASFEMSEKTRGAVKTLLAIDSREQFAELCTWADEVAASRPETAGWHRMFVPRSATTVDLARDCADARTCVIAAIDRNIALLQEGGPAPVMAEALKFLMNLVGDLHQPLNIGYAEDRGGADITARFRGRETSLREIWESGLLEARPEGWREIAESYDKRFTYLERRRWPSGTTTDWANESLWIARTPATGYLGNPGGLEYGEIYVRQNQLVALRRMSQAGVRLAAILNRTFDR